MTLPSRAQVDSIPGDDRITGTDDRISLSHAWKYRLGDDPRWAMPNVNDSDWDTISSFFDPVIFDSVNTPVIWFRKLVFVDSTATGIPFTMRIYFSGKVSLFLDGNNILEKEENRSLFNNFVSPWESHVFKEEGVHCVAVRLQVDDYAFFRKAGFFIGFNLSFRKVEPALNGSLDFVRKETAIQFIFVILPLAFAVLHFILFLYFRKSRANLYYALILLFLSLATFADIQSTNFLAGHLITIQTLRFHRAIIIPLQIFILLFTYSVFTDRIPKTFWFLVILIFGTGLLAVIRPDTNYRLFSLSGILMMTEVIRIISIGIRNKKRDAWFFAFGFTLILIFSSYDLLLDLGIMEPFRGFRNAYFIGYIGMYITMSILLSKQIAETSRELENKLMEVKILSDKTIQQEKEKQEILSKQKEELEYTVAERTRELAHEKEKTENLLLNTLPLKVVEDLKKFGISNPELYQDVTVLFSDFVGFTEESVRLGPKNLIRELNELFTIFDTIIEENSCERIKTIGDAYVAVCGMPVSDALHAEKMVAAAIEIIQKIKLRNSERNTNWQVRIGISSGPVVGGIVGIKKYIYDIFGDTVNMAARMEQHSEPMEINISSSTYNLLKSNFICQPRNNVTVKGKGEIDMYFVKGRDGLV